MFFTVVRCGLLIWICRDLKLEEMKEFEEEREKLMKMHEEKLAEMKNRHWNEEIELEKGFDAELTLLMDKYTPKS